MAGIENERRHLSLWFLILLFLLILFSVLWGLQVTVPVSRATEFFASLGLAGGEAAGFDRLLPLAGGLGLAAVVFVTFLYFLHSKD